LFPAPPRIPQETLNAFKGAENEDKSSLTKEALQAFVTESPFSFKNPIFFSVPRDGHNQKKVGLLQSNRQLFQGSPSPSPQQ